jgi:hypothetical protein
MQFVNAKPSSSWQDKIWTEHIYPWYYSQQLITSVFFYSRDPFGPNSKAHTARIPRDDNESHWLDRERWGFDYKPKKLAHPFHFSGGTDVVLRTAQIISQSPRLARHYFMELSPCGTFSKSLWCGLKVAKALSSVHSLLSSVLFWSVCVLCSVVLWCLGKGALKRLYLGYISYLLTFVF